MLKSKKPDLTPAEKAPTRPGRKFIAGPVEEDLYNAVNKLGGKLNLNTTQMIRKAMAEMLERNSETVPDATRQQLEQDKLYTRGRPRKGPSRPTDPDSGAPTGKPPRDPA